MPSCECENSAHDRVMLLKCYRKMLILTIILTLTLTPILIITVLFILTLTQILCLSLTLIIIVHGVVVSSAYHLLIVHVTFEYMHISCVPLQEAEAVTVTRCRGNLPAYQFSFKACTIMILTQIIESDWEMNQACTVRVQR